MRIGAVRAVVGREETEADFFKELTFGGIDEDISSRAANFADVGFSGVLKQNEGTLACSPVIGTRGMDITRMFGLSTQKLEDM